MPDEDLTPEIGTEEADVTPKVDPAPTAEAEPETEEQPPVTEPTPEPEEVPAPAEPATPSLDERYRNSTSEALILNSKNKSLESTLKQLTSEDTPTESELLAEYPEFSQYNAVTQKLMRDTLENRKRQLRINLTLIEQQAERKLDTELRTITRKPEYAVLRGDEKFEEFVLLPKHQGVDIQTLADAYMVRTGKIQPVQPVAAKAPATPGLPRGSGGIRNQKPAKVTLEQAKVIRETNYREYLRLVKANMIEELE